MKKLFLIGILLLSHLSAFADCNLSGKFKITGDWTSFSTWFIELENGSLIDSYTDDLPAKDFPTVLNVESGSYLKLTQTTYASDAIIDIALHLIARCQDGKLLLEPMAGYEAYFDETVSQDHTSVIETLNLVVAPY